MFVKQVSVFLENEKGTLGEMTELLGRNNVDMIAISVAAQEQYGIVRLVVKDADVCAAVLREAGFVCKLTDVVCVSVPDAPNGLARTLAYLSGTDISVNYLYSLVRSKEGKAMLILRLSDQEQAVKIFAEKGVEILSQEQVKSL